MKAEFKKERQEILAKVNDKALRYNDGKPQWSLVDFDSLEPLVRVLEYGAKKYSKNNWKKGLDKQQILESLMRHLIKLMNNELVDEESQEQHIGHILANAMFYSYFSNNNPKECGI